MAHQFPEVEALRQELSRFFPQLTQNSAKDGRAPINNGAGQATNVANGANNEAHAQNDGLHLKTSLWHAFQPADLSAKSGSPDQKRSGVHGLRARAQRVEKAKIIYALYTEYWRLLVQDGEQDVEYHPVLVRVRQTTKRDMDGAIAMLETAIGRHRFRKTLSRSRRDGRWRRQWQKRRQKAAKSKNQSQSQEASKSRPTKNAALRLPRRPPPLPPCLQCVQAGTCCSLTTRPYAQAFADDRAGAGAGAGIAKPVKRASLQDEYRKLVDSLADVADCSAYAARLEKKKRELHVRLLCDALRSGAVESPFLAEPPVQCARCARRGDRGCLQQSRDLTGATDRLADDSHPGSMAWFASSGPPPRSLLKQHCQPLLDQVRGLRPTTDSTVDGDEEVGLRLEAVFCRDASAMTAAEVAAQAQSLLWRIFRQSQRAGEMVTGSRSSSSSGSAPFYLAALGPDKKKKPATGQDDAAVSRLPMLRRPRAQAPVPPAAPLAVAQRLPNNSPLNVYTGTGVATAALAYRQGGVSEAADSDDDDDDLGNFAPPPAVPLWYPGRRSSGDAAPLPVQHREYFLDVGEARAARALQQEREAAHGREEKDARPAILAAIQAHRSSGGSSTPDWDEHTPCGAGQDSSPRNEHRAWSSEEAAVRMERLRARLAAPSRPPATVRMPTSRAELVALGSKLGVTEAQLERYFQRKRENGHL